MKILEWLTITLSSFFLMLLCLSFRLLFRPFQPSPSALPHNVIPVKYINNCRPIYLIIISIPLTQSCEKFFSPEKKISIALDSIFVSNHFSVMSSGGNKQYSCEMKMLLFAIKSSKLFIFINKKVKVCRSRRSCKCWKEMLIYIDFRCFSKKRI